MRGYVGKGERLDQNTEDSCPDKIEDSCPNKENGDVMGNNSTSEVGERATEETDVVAIKVEISEEEKALNKEQLEGVHWHVASICQFLDLFAEQLLLHSCSAEDIEAGLLSQTSTAEDDPFSAFYVTLLGGFRKRAYVLSECDGLLTRILPTLGYTLPLEAVFWTQPIAVKADILLTLCNGRLDLANEAEIDLMGNLSADEMRGEPFCKDGQSFIWHLCRTRLYRQKLLKRRAGRGVKSKQQAAIQEDQWTLLASNEEEWTTAIAQAPKGVASELQELLDTTVQEEFASARRKARREELARQQQERLEAERALAEWLPERRVSTRRQQQKEIERLKRGPSPPPDDDEHFTDHEHQKLSRAERAERRREGLPAPRTSNIRDEHEEMRAELRDIIQELSAQTFAEMFIAPVNGDLVPDYYTVIKSPMCIRDMSQRCYEEAPDSYTEPEQLEDDFELLRDNAVLYNGAISKIANWAIRLHKLTLRLLHNYFPEKYVKSAVCGKGKPLYIRKERELELLAEFAPPSPLPVEHKPRSRHRPSGQKNDRRKQTLADLYQNSSEDMYDADSLDAELNSTQIDPVEAKRVDAELDAIIAAANLPARKKSRHPPPTVLVQMHEDHTYAAPPGGTQPKLMAKDNKTWYSPSEFMPKKSKQRPATATPQHTVYAGSIKRTPIILLSPSQSDVTTSPASSTMASHVSQVIAEQAQVAAARQAGHYNVPMTVLTDPYGGTLSRNTHLQTVPPTNTAFSLAHTTVQQFPRAVVAQSLTNDWSPDLRTHPSESQLMTTTPHTLSSAQFVIRPATESPPSTTASSSEVSYAQQVAMPIGLTTFRQSDENV